MSCTPDELKSMDGELDWNLMHAFSMLRRGMSCTPDVFFIQSILLSCLIVEGLELLMLLTCNRTSSIVVTAVNYSVMLYYG
jgi:hypothetical protein